MVVPSLLHPTKPDPGFAETRLRDSENFSLPSGDFRPRLQVISSLRDS
jgi:hypothetical protein